MDPIEEALEAYWNAAFREGAAGAKTDDGTAQAALHTIQAGFRALFARVARWIRVTPADEKPPIGIPVRVVWSCRDKSDPKRAVWTGAYWATSRRTGHFEDIPDYWLYEPPLPELNLPDSPGSLACLGMERDRYREALEYLERHGAINGTPLGEYILRVLNPQSPMDPDVHRR
jgi:hypothetical protein